MLKKALIIGGIALTAIAVTVAAIVIKIVCFPPYQNYSIEYVEVTYYVDSYASDPAMTKDTQIRVSKTKPSQGDGAFVVAPVSGGEWYYVFDNLNAKVAEVEMSALQNKQIIFTVTFKNGDRGGFSLYSYDWDKGCNVIGTKISFKRKEHASQPFGRSR